MKESLRIAGFSLWASAALVALDLARLPSGLQDPGGAPPAPAEIIVKGGLLYATAALLLGLATAIASLFAGRRPGLPAADPASTAPLLAGCVAFSIVSATLTARLAGSGRGTGWLDAPGLLALLAIAAASTGAGWLAARAWRLAGRGGIGALVRAGVAVAPLPAVAILSVLLLIGGAGAGRSPAASPASEDLPDVLLIVTEGLRADALSCCGGPAALPALDALSARGVTLTQAIATAPAEPASTASILTGLLPPEIGEGWEQEEIAPEVVTLAGSFASRGYATGAVVSSRDVSLARGLDRGFDHWDESWDRSFPARHPTALAARLMRALGWRPREEPPAARDVVDRGLAWMDASRGRPRFLYLHFQDPQDPYAPPEDVRGSLGGYAPGEGAFGSLDLAAALRGEVTMDAASLRRARAFYDAEVAFLDHEIGRLLTALGETMDSGRLLVAFASSHGEEFLDHGSLGHGHTLHQELVRVPVIVARPGHLPEGRSVAEPISLVDLAPTLLEAAGLPPEASFRGRSAVARLTGEGHGASERTPLLSVMDAVGYHTMRHWSRSARLGRWKVLLTSTDVLGLNPWRRDVFDLESDPAELESLEGGPESAWLEAWLREWMREHPPGRGLATGFEQVASRDNEAGHDGI